MVEPHMFEKQLAAAWDPATWSDVTVVVAVSGGADSVALLLGLQTISLQPAGQTIVAHFNHRLRGDESDEDERFVQQLCCQLDLPCERTRATSPVASLGDGVEAQARHQRYQFLREVAHRSGARFVATAHTANDQAETILHRVVRGTGLAGLAGIPTARPLSEMTTVIRPMLSLTRATVRSYLDDRTQSFRDDSSNESEAFTRNRIRHLLMPMLSEQFNVQVVPALLRLGNLAREAQQVIDTVVEPLCEMAVSRSTPQRVELTCTPLRHQPPFLVQELLVRIWKLQRWPRQDMGEARWRQLCEMAQGHGVHRHSVTFPGDIQAEVDGDMMTLHKSGH